MGSRSPIEPPDVRAAPFQALLGFATSHHAGPDGGLSYVAKPPGLS